MDQIFRLADITDVEIINSIYKKAIAAMRSQGIEQWDDIYPNEGTLKGDIDRRQMYILLQDEEIMSIVVLNEEQDEEYQTGDWCFSGEKTAVLHRLCVNPAVQKTGVGKKTVLLAEQLLAEKGYRILRLDTFSQNPPAIRLYESLGYRRAGVVLFRKGEFLLFEKRLSRCDDGIEPSRP